MGIKLIPSIISGGAGSRLWPLSRKLHPKPFIRLPDGRSLLQKAFSHAACLDGVEEILTITNSEIFFKTKSEYQTVNTDSIKTSYILEPFGRNTAAAIATAAFYVAEVHGPEALVLVLPADHLIENQKAFQQAVSEATALASFDQKLVMFGMEVLHPETGYGYIRVKDNQVLQFVEKPSKEKAQQYLDTGEYLWNSGMFCFSAKTLLNELKIHCPDIHDATALCLQHSRRDFTENNTHIVLNSETFKDIPENSIDYALIEKSTQTAVVPCDMGWNDIGSWTAFADLTPVDSSNNRIQGEVLLRDVDNCYIQTPHRLTGALGVQNLLVVDTPDALLIADKSRAQEVKHFYETLKAQNHDAHKLHQTVHRPWGTYTVLEEGQGFKIKRIEVEPKSSLSLQMHRFRSEHWVVISGEASVTNGDEVKVLKANQSTYIPAGNKHRLENTTDEPVVIIEVQTGDYLGENDIVRYEDVYGREVLV